MVRPISNLSANRDFSVKPVQLRKGFLSAWRGAPSGKTGRGSLSPVDFYRTLVFNTLFPATRGRDLKTANAQSAFFRDEDNVHVVKSVLRRDMGLKAFTFTTPFMRRFLGSASLGAALEIANAYEAPKVGSPEEAEELLSGGVKTLDQTIYGKGPVSGSALASMVNFTGAAHELVAKSIKEVEFKIEGSELVGYITWIISKEEAEYLNNASFLEIKFASFYPVLLDWSGGVMGQFTRLPTTITAISKIAQQVAKSQEEIKARPRVGIDGIVVDIQKRLFAFPEVNNTLQFEQRLQDFGSQEDGSYCWRPNVDVGSEVVLEALGGPKRLPANIPVFTDWVNDKFAYSNTVGKLAVFDLGSTVAARSTHLRQALEDWADLDQEKVGTFGILSTAVTIASAFDKSILTESPFDDLDPEQKSGVDPAKLFPANTTSLAAMVTASVDAHVRLNPYETDLYSVGGKKVPKIFDLNPDTGVVTFRWIGRILIRALDAIENNKEAALLRYSVLTVYQAVATLRVFSKYAFNMGALITSDESERDPYLNQQLDPDYEVESLPNIQKNLKYLPHQFRTHNRMRRGPKFAIWGVGAGGGKSILTLTNILNELKNKRCSRPIIACPPHLVSNYVKEVVYVTEGKLNLIPVTNMSLKQHGYEALAKLIMNAPPNSVVITDFNFLKGKSQEVSYGNKTINVFQNAEFLRQFEFDLIVVDEVHFLKNLKSTRRHAAARFMQDIPMKRIASGTLVADTLVDLVSQVALVDPTIFGTVENFVKEYAEDYRGTKVLSWRAGAESEVRKKLEQNVVYAEAKRKEWAAALPKSTERFVFVDLTEQQRLVYTSILEETTELIEQAAQKDPKLRAMMDSEDESMEDALEAKLRPYLARLERFLSNPEIDPLSEKLLTDPIDKVSPKALKVYDIIRDHEQGVLGKDSKGDKVFTEDGGPVPGKILIFTQYTASAEHVFENAPPDIRSKMIHYTADQKEECRVAFETDPTKTVMIGVSSSMDTGLNFQHVSRLIRLETVWTPGVLEQGNSRINRPELKNVEQRKQIFFDWIAANRTVDITKVARLISKVVSAEKFYNHDDPAYQNLEDLPKIPMKMDSIRENNDFRSELMPYLECFREFQQVQHADYENYRRENPDSLTAVQVPSAGNLPGSKLLSRVPYVPDMAIYKAEQLGLVRYDQYLRFDADALEEDEDDEGEDSGDDDEDTEDTDELDPKDRSKADLRAKLREERIKMRNRPVHTEFGDGVIVGLGRMRVRVLFPDGTRKSINKMKVYVITRSSTNNVDLRNELLKQVGEIPIDKPIQVPATTGAADKKRQLKAAGVDVDSKPKRDETLRIKLSLNVVNDYLALVYSAEDAEKEAAQISALQNFGFQISPQYVFARIMGPVRLLALFRGFKDAGFKISPEQSATFKNIWYALTQNKKAFQNFGFASQFEIKLFQKEQIRPSADQSLLKVYPIVEDQRLYVAMPLQGQSSTRKAMRIRPMDIKWEEGGGTSEIVRFVRTKAEALAVIKELITAGIEIQNLERVRKQYEAIKMTKR